MDSYTTIWNNFCKNVIKAKENNQKEITFEKSTMIDLLSSLGWSQLRNNLIEQKRMSVGHTEVFADFVLVDADSKKEQIVIELKRPKHTQTQEDIEQLASYMKQSYCPYGLYIGEKIEIYYNKLDDRNEPVLINSIEYTMANKEGIFLLNLLRYESFNPTKWKDYCEDSIKLMQSVEYWTSEKGKAALFQFILDKAGLSPNFTERLRTLLTISVEKNQFKPLDDKQNSTCKPSDIRIKDKSTGSNKVKGKVYNFKGRSYNAKNYALAIVKELIAEHPEFTYVQIKSVFPKSFSWGPILLQLAEWKTKKESVRENYFGDEILNDVNGVQFVLSNQWTHEGVAEMKKCFDKITAPGTEHFVSEQIYNVSKQDEHIQVEPSFKMPNRGNTVYSINGGKNFFPASAIGYYVIKRYLQEHPDATIEDIRTLLPTTVFGYKTLVDEKTWKEKYVPGIQKHLRYVPFGFTDGCGKRFYVSNQWDKKTIESLERLIIKIGWKVDKMIKG